jgi:hypothetical protein
MPNFRPAQLLICLTLQATLSAELFLDNNFDSALVQSPFRINELEGDRIVELSKLPSSTPLIYPKAVSVFERFDASLPKFYTLEELASNPGLMPYYRFHSNSAVVKQKKFSEVSGQLNLSDREKQLFDTSLLLVPKNTNPLPNDDQLRAFLEEGRQRYTPPVNPKEIIDNLLKDEYSNNPVLSLLNESPDVKKVLKSESFNQSTDGLFNSANIALKQPVRKRLGSTYQEELPEPPSFPEEPTQLVSDLGGPTVLKLQARKPSRDGTLKPAQASEIYLTTQDLKELLKDMTKDPAIAGEVRSVAELWAKAEKNGSRNPEIALGVKSILLSAKVGRARTDPYGKASLENLSPDDKYYVIGIDKDIETDVVTIWSKEVEVAPGENLVELSSTDIIYQE